MPVRMDSSSVAIDMTSRGILPAVSPGRHRTHLSEEYATVVSDSRFDNSLSSNLSRSPSVGDTFVSAATDGPLSASGSDSSSSDEDDHDGVELGRIGVMGSPSLNSNHNSATAFDQVPSLPFENSVGLIRPLSPGEGPSGSTSISMSMGSMGNGSGAPVAIKLDITVRTITEKKGLFLKNSEYEIETESSAVKVRRKYKDFSVLHDYLLERYPYRMIPIVPPNQMMFESLLEERRHGLQTWITVIAMHPVLGESPILKVFLNDASPEFQYRMRVAYERQVDEYSRLRQDVEPVMPDYSHISDCRKKLRDTFQFLTKLGRLFDEQAFRYEQQVHDMGEVDEILRNLKITDMHNSELNFTSISQTLNDAAMQSEHYMHVQRYNTNERINVLVSLLDAHDALCGRVEKGIFAVYQDTFEDTGKLRKKTPIEEIIKAKRPKKDIPAAHNADNPEDLVRKSWFASKCVLSETTVVEQFLQTLPGLLLAYAKEASLYHDKMSKTWHQLEAKESASKL